MTRYASDTSVPAERSRGEMERLQAPVPAELTQAAQDRFAALKS